jgi:hypothetical protein
MCMCPQVPVKQTAPPGDLTQKMNALLSDDCPTKVASSSSIGKLATFQAVFKENVEEIAEWCRASDEQAAQLKAKATELEEARDASDERVAKLEAKVSKLMDIIMAMQAAAVTGNGTEKRASRTTAFKAAMVKKVRVASPIVRAALTGRTHHRRTLAR